MREPKLDPVRRPRLPRARTTLRLMIVAALLLTAAAALYTGQPTCPPPVASAPRSPGGAAPAVSERPTADRTPDSRRSVDPTPAQLGRLPAPPGTVGVPVRLADPAALALVRAGDRVDLLAGGRQVTVLATGALVLAVALDEGALLLALGPHQARDTAGARPGTAFSITVRP